MSKSAAALLIAFLSASTLNAADEALTQCIARGVKYLKSRHSAEASGGGASGHISAPLEGLALLEGGVPTDDPAIRNITKLVRARALTLAKTYDLSLAIMYLDRLGDRVDRPVIQLLAVQVMAGQKQLGSWGYTTRFALTGNEPERLRKLFYEGERSDAKDEAAGLHPEVARFAKSIEADVAQERKKVGDDGLDNSNTQFAVMALWIARRHGVSCDDALALAEKRFRDTQRRDGGWSYTANDNILPNSPALLATPSMTCAGLLGLAAGRGIRLDALRAKSAKGGDSNEKSNPPADQATAAGFKYLERALVNPKFLVLTRGFTDLRDN